MDKVARVGIDLAKKVFHVTAVDDNGAVLERKRMRRTQLQSYLAHQTTGCVVAMEAWLLTTNSLSLAHPRFSTLPFFRNATAVSTHRLHSEQGRKLNCNGRYAS